MPIVGQNSFLIVIEKIVGIIQTKSPLSERISLYRARFFVTVTFLVLCFFWNSPILVPLRMLIVMMHELGHALAAVATGGEFIEFVYDYSEGGSSVTRGGNQFLIFNAGYLGSCLFGSLLLVLACRTDLDKLLTFLVGLSIGVLTFLYAGPTADRTFAYIVAVLAMFTAIQLPNIISEAILILVGLASNAYAFFDIMEDVIFKRNASVC